MTLAESLKRFRIANRLTKTAMAAELQITPQAYGSYETGETAPSVKSLMTLAKAHNVSLDYLTGLTEDTRPANQILAEYQRALSGENPDAVNDEIRRLKADNAKLKAQITKLQDAITVLIKD